MQNNMVQLIVVKLEDSGVIKFINNLISLFQLNKIKILNLQDNMKL